MTCRISLSEWNGRRIIRLEGGDFLPQQQTEVRSAAKTFLDTDSSEPILIDTTGLGLVGSCCLASLIEVGMSCRKRSIPCALIESRASILEVFEVVSIQSILPVILSKEEPF